MCIYEGCNNEEEGLCSDCRKAISLRKKGKSKEEIIRLMSKDYIKPSISPINRKINGMTADEIDKLLIVKGLREIENWSFNKIARLLSIDPKTAKSLYMKALEQSDQGNLLKSGVLEGKPKIINTDNVDKWQRINMDILDGKDLISNYDGEF